MEVGVAAMEVAVSAAEAVALVAASGGGAAETRQRHSRDVIDTRWKRG